MYQWQLGHLLLQPLLFFQAEDGIRSFHVTGVQTCALPIWGWLGPTRHRGTGEFVEGNLRSVDPQAPLSPLALRHRPHRNPRSAGTPHHVCGPPPARKRDAQVSTRISHLLVADWPRSAAMATPVRWIRHHMPAQLTRHVGSNPVGAARTTMDEDGARLLVVFGEHLADRHKVLVVPPSGHDDLHVELPYSRSLRGRMVLSGRSRRRPRRTAGAHPGTGGAASGVWVGRALAPGGAQGSGSLTTTPPKRL